MTSFLKRRTLKSWVGLDLDRSVEKAYGVISWPKTIIIDGKGDIVAETRARVLSAEKLDQLLSGDLTVFGSGTSKEQPAGNLATKPPAPVKPNESERALVTISVKPSKVSSMMMGGAPGRFQAMGRT